MDAAGDGSRSDDTRPRGRRVPATGREDQELFQSLRTALRSGEPLDLLAVVSGFLEVTDPRSRDPFAPDEQRASLDDLVESFIGTPYAETTAALTAIRPWCPTRCWRPGSAGSWTSRRHPMPDWLTGLDRRGSIPDVWFMTHVLGDGDDYLVGVTLPSGHALSALVYVDHNLGTVVKDAFVVPEPLEDLAIKMGTLIDDPDQSLTRTDPATARAVVEAAIELRLAAVSAADLRQLADVPAAGRVDAADAARRRAAPERKEWSRGGDGGDRGRLLRLVLRRAAGPRGRAGPAGERAVVRHRLRDRRPVAVEPGDRGDAAGRLVPAQGDRGAVVPREAAGPRARLHPLLPRPQRHPRRPDRGDPGRGRPVRAGVPAS